MAKVTGPLFSLSASGQIGKAMVHFGWKGINCVREWKAPSNPRTEDQANIRLRLGGLGRGVRAVGVPSDFQADALTSAPSGQTWGSALVGYMLKNVLDSAANYETFITEFGDHAEDAKFTSEAALLEMSDFDIEYKGAAVSVFSAGAQLYALAKYAMAQKVAVPGVFDRAPYTTALASWSAANIETFVADLS